MIRVSLEDVLATSFPWCAVWAAELKQLFAVYVEAKQRQKCPRFCLIQKMTIAAMQIADVKVWVHRSLLVWMPASPRANQ
jgi:hypothetical protein